jgi:hypothetical protein
LKTLIIIFGFFAKRRISCRLRGTTARDEIYTISGSPDSIPESQYRARGRIASRTG